MAGASALDRKYLLLSPCYPGIQVRKLGQYKYLNKKRELRRVSLGEPMQEMEGVKEEITLPEIAQVDPRKRRSSFGNAASSSMLRAAPRHVKGKSMDFKHSHSKSGIWDRILVDVGKSVRAAESAIRLGRKFST